MKINPYLNFPGNSEEAFNFYKAVFGGEFLGGIMRYENMPDDGRLSGDDLKKVMHIALRVGDSTLMATDTLPAFGQESNFGNNYYLCLQPDSREDAERYYNELSQGGVIEMELAEQSWGDYFGCFIDKFGVQWMIAYELQEDEKG